MLKKKYRKIGKKNNNDVETDVTQLKRSNNKYYTSIYIYICVCVCVCVCVLEVLWLFKH